MLDFLMYVLAKKLLMDSLDTPFEYYVQQHPELPQTSVPLHHLLPWMIKPAHHKTFL
jgi:hypothetical protein